MVLDNAVNNLDNIEQIESDLSALSSIDSEICLQDNMESELGEVREILIKTDVDAELSETSENPVQNRVITAEINSIKETYATKDFVEENGGKIDSISVNNVPQQIINKNVNIDLSGYATTSQAEDLQDSIENVSKEIENVSSDFEEQIGNTNKKFDDYAKLKASQTFTGSQTIVGSLTIEGDIIQNGETYITQAEKVETEDDYIVMRKGATGGLGNGYSGFEIKNYNGNNEDVRLVVDGEGTARVGDIGDEQPLLTREEGKDLTDGEVLVWNATTNRAEGSADYVKNTDYATTSTAGVVKINPKDGIGIGNTTKMLYISPATQAEINAKTSTRRPLVPNTLDYAVKVGVTTNTITLTDGEKASATNWLGAVKQEEGKGLSSNDFTQAYIDKIAELENSFPTVTRLV